MPEIDEEIECHFLPGRTCQWAITEIEMQSLLADPDVDYISLLPVPSSHLCNTCLTSKVLLLLLGEEAFPEAEKVDFKLEVEPK